MTWSGRGKAVAWLLFAVGLWCLGWHLHLGGGTLDAAGVIYGDKGDGLFNLWVLEHLRLHAPTRLDEPGIFWPLQQQAFFWSDNLLVPGCLYRLCYSLSSNLFAAYMHTAWLMSAILFGLLVWFFREIEVVTLRAGRAPFRGGAWLYPCLAYVACFSQNRIMYLGRFQTLSSMWLVLLLIAGVRYLRAYRRRDLLLLAGAETLALYSAPYDGLLGALLIMLCGGCLLVRPGFRWGEWLRHHGPWLLLFLPSTVWIVMQYQRAGTVSYPLEEIAARSLTPLNLVVPICGWSRVVWERWLEGALPGLWPGGFMGSGVLLASGIAVLMGLHGAWQRKWLSGLGATLREWRQSAGGVALLFLVAALVVSLALASGSSGRGPSLLEGLRPLLPGFASLREPIRFTPTAQTIWIGLLLAGWLRLAVLRPARPLAMLLLIGVLGLQFSETMGVRAKTTRLFEEELMLSAEERTAFAALSGTVLMVPSAPFQLNVRNQFFLQPLPDLMTVNGYSGRSSPLFSRLMELEANQGILSEDQVEVAAASGIDYLVVVKYYLSAEQLALARQKGEILLDLPRFLVLDLS